MRKKYKYKRLKLMDRYFPFDDSDYPEEMIEEELDNDAIKSYEAGFWGGYNKKD